MLEDYRVQLRLFDCSNHLMVSFMFRVRTNPEVTKYLSGPMPKDLTEHTQYLNRISKTDKRFFIIVAGDAERMIGYCQITPHDESLELGWALDPKFHGHGFGQQAVKLLIDSCAILYPQYKRLHLIVKASNKKAVHIYQKYGFEISNQSESVDEIIMRRKNDGVFTKDFSSDEHVLQEPS